MWRYGSQDEDRSSLFYRMNKGNSFNGCDYLSKNSILKQILHKPNTNQMRMKHTSTKLEQKHSYGTSINVKSWVFQLITNHLQRGRNNPPIGESKQTKKKSRPIAEASCTSSRRVCSYFNNATRMCVCVCVRSCGRMYAVRPCPRPRSPPGVWTSASPGVPAALNTSFVSPY